MHALNKNSYLQSRTCGVNPRIINRCVDRARDLIDFDDHDIEPPFNRLCSEQPCMPIGNIDVTRRPLAFGRRAIPKLIVELHDDDLDVRVQALTSLSDILHDPERGAEALRYRLPDRLIDLLRHWMAEIRERTCMCLLVLAGSLDGRHAILRKKQMLENLALTIEDDESDVRYKMALVLEMISIFPTTGDILVEAGFVEKLLENLDDKYEITAIHLETLRNIMYCDGKNRALDAGGFEIFTELLDCSSEEVQAGAAACLALLTSITRGKDIALETKLLKKLNELIRSEDVEVQTQTASAIMYCSVKTKAKVKVAKLKKLPERLLDLAKNPLYPSRQLFCIKALTNICEHPKIREHMKENFVTEVERIEVKPGNPDLCRHKEILLGIINWVPTVG